MPAVTDNVTAPATGGNSTLPEVLVKGFHELFNVTVYSAFPEGNHTNGASGDGMIPFDIPSENANNSLFIKIVLLLILTAVVLLSTYKFVVRLFSGYSEKKDDSSEYYIGIQESW